MTKVGRNDPCSCGSGKKHKNCCLINPKPQKSFFERISSDEAQVFTRITSKDGQGASINISQASVTRNGVTKILLDDEITLSTNKVPGDTTSESSAILTIPINQSEPSKIRTTGNASVTNDKESYFGLEILDAMKITVKSPNGLFALIRVCHQADKNFDFLSILFGVAGQVEFKNAEGRKNRSDIAIYSTGNGKFIRLSDENCNIDQSWLIESILTYDPVDKNIYPSKLVISSTDHAEKLTLSFNFDVRTKKVILMNATFN